MSVKPWNRQQGEDGALGVGEGLGEAVVQGGGQGRAAALRGVIGHRRGPGPQLLHERLDLVFAGVVGAEGLPGQDGDGQRVALGEGQQRPPVLHLQERLRAAGLPGGDRAGELEPLEHRHRRQRNPGRQVPEPAPLVPAGGQQHPAPGLVGEVAQEPGQLVLLGGGPGAVGAGREPGDRLDVVPDPQHRHLRQHPQRHVPPLPVIQGGPLHPGALQSRPELAADLVQQPGQGQVVLEGGEQHPGGAAGQRVPAGELQHGGRLPRPGPGVQQHHPVAVEGPVQRQQRLIAAEEPRIRPGRQPPLQARPLLPRLGLAQVNREFILALLGGSRASGAAS